jgi:hypothetical protein
MIQTMDHSVLVQWVDNQLPIRKKEKDIFGEVFTSSASIEEMLDMFPASIWMNPNYKWLDPCVGTGGFMAFIFMRLMDGLSPWQPHVMKRATHIIKNMLFMVELNPDNCKKCKTLFGPKVNLHCGDFLTSSHPFQFDCIVGNPPFHDNYGLNKKGKKIRGGKNKLYERIFMKCVEILNSNGYLSFVVPDNLFAGNGSDAYQILLSHHIPQVHFRDHFFDQIQQPVCYFLFQKNFLFHKNPSNKNPSNKNPSNKNPSNKSHRKTTTIHWNQSNPFSISLQDRPVNPIRNWTPQTEKWIEQYVSLERNEVKYIRGHSIESYKGSKYPVVYKKGEKLHTNDMSMCPGLGIKKAIVFAISTQLEFEMDYMGKWGAGPNTFYIPFQTDVQGRRLEAFLLGEVCQTLALATKTSRQYIKIAFMEYMNWDEIMDQNKKKKKKQTRKKKIKTNQTKKRK